MNTEMDFALRLSDVINQLAWPEVRGQMNFRPGHSHVIHNDFFSIAVGPHARTVMFRGRGTIPVFLNVPQSIDYNSANYIATEFLDWVRKGEGYKKPNLYYIGYKNGVPVKRDLTLEETDEYLLKIFSHCELFTFPMEVYDKYNDF